MKIGRAKALWKVPELWKNQKTVFPQLLGPSVHTSHNAGCYWTFLKHNFPSTPRDGSAERRWGTELQLGSGKSLDDDHGSSALGTEPKEVCRLKLGSLWLVRRGECAEKLQTEWQQSGASAIGEDAKMANSDEAFGKQVQKEATQELIQG